LVVVDDLDVVPVGVEHERAVVAGVVDRSLARRLAVRGPDVPAVEFDDLGLRI